LINSIHPSPLNLRHCLTLTYTNELEELKEKLSLEFERKDLSSARHILGMDTKRPSGWDTTSVST